MNDSEKTDDLVERLARAVFDGEIEAVQQALKDGADPGAEWTRSETLLELATRWYAHPEIVQALIDGGAPVPKNALESLGAMEVTDWIIETQEDEQSYARVAEILLSHGASPNVSACNGMPLIEYFPEDCYPIIHRILAGAMKSEGGD